MRNRRLGDRVCYAIGGVKFGINACAFAWPPLQLPLDFVIQKISLD
jgi:hypothetical protein